MIENKYIDLKPLNIKKNKSIFKSFTNASIIGESNYQPYLGKEIIINTTEILSIYPSEDNIGTMIHSKNNQSTWKVLENIKVVIERINE
jgi:hypothetical protein